MLEERAEPDPRRGEPRGGPGAAAGAGRGPAERRDHAPPPRVHGAGRDAGPFRDSTTGGAPARGGPAGGGDAGGGDGEGVGVEAGVWAGAAEEERVAGEVAGEEVHDGAEEAVRGAGGVLWGWDGMGWRGIQ